MILFSLISLSFFYPPNTTQAAINEQINYQGKLLDATNSPVADGTYSIVFSLYTQPTGGSNIWTETNSITVTSGLFSVMLGSSTSLSEVDFNQTLYLGINVAADGEMTPRKILGTVPSAFEANNAQTLNNIVDTSFLRSDQDDTASGLLTFTGGFISNASTTIANLSSTIATTTTLVINGESFTDLTGTALTNTSGVLSVDTAYLDVLYATSTAFDTESELETLLSDVTNIFTNNDTIGDANISNTITVSNYLALSGGTLSGQLDFSGTAANIALGSNWLSGDGTDEGIYVAVSGSVGVGTSSPASVLDVWGDFRVGTSSTPSLLVDASANQVIIGTTTPHNQTNAGLYLEDRGISFRNSGNLSRTNSITSTILGYLEFDGPAAHLFNIGSTEAMRMSNTGALFNNNSNPTYDFRVESDNNQYMFFIDSNVDTVGIATSTATQTFTVDGSTYLTGALYDNSNSAGTNGYILQTTGTGFLWVATSTLGLGGSTETNSLESTITGIEDTEIFIGTGSNAGNYVVVGGDATLANTGALTLASTITSVASLSNLVTVGALNSGSIAASFGNIDNGTSNITTGGILGIDVDGSGINAVGSLTLGAGNDAALYWNGTNLELDTSTGIQFSINGTPEADLASDGFNLITGDSYQINNTSVLNATTLGSTVVNSSLTGVGTLSSGTFSLDSLSYTGTLDDTYINDALTISSLGTIDPQAITLATGYILYGDASNNALATSSLFVATDGRVGIGTTTPESILNIENTALTGNINGGIKQDIGFLNTTLNAVQYGDRSYLTIDSTATSTVVGEIIRVEDNTTLGNTIRGLEVQANRGANTLGENTALSGFARTFGVRGYSSADAGGTYEPAGGFFETGGSTQGNAIRGYSGSITTSELLSLFQDTSAFTGTGLLMNFGNSGGSFASTTSKFVDLQNAGTSKFTITAQGTTTLGDGTTNNMAGLQIGYGGLCVDNDGSCVASTTGRISSVSSFTGNSDLAEMYFSSQDLVPGEIVVSDGFLSVTRATGAEGEQVLGVISTKPGLLLGADDTSLTANQQGYPLALSGRVPVRLSDENGIIEVGDPLMLSSLPGIAMKATKAAEIVGYSLEAFDGTYAYSEGFVNQFGDDIVEPNYDAINVNPDTMETNPCRFGGGVATGEEGEPCDSENAYVEVSDDDNQEAIAQARYQAEQSALQALKNKPATSVLIDDDNSVRVGQVIMFVDRGFNILSTQTDILNELVSTSEDLVLSTQEDSGETLWDRIKTLAQGFVDGILTIGGLTADLVKSNKIETNELCIDNVCVTANDLRAFLDSASTGAQNVEINEDNDTDTSGDANNNNHTSDDTNNTDDEDSQTQEEGNYDHDIGDTSSSTEETTSGDGDSIASTSPEINDSETEDTVVDDENIEVGGEGGGGSGEGEEMTELPEVEPEDDSITSTDNSPEESIEGPSLEQDSPQIEQEQVAAEESTI